MNVPLSPPDLANAVTSFCTIGAGLLTLALCRLVAPQPGRWVAVYAFLFLTGLPTLGWHGWAGEAWRVTDTGSNLLLAYVIQWAVLGDFYGPATRRWVGGLSGLINAAGILWMISEAITGVHIYVVDLGEFGGFYAGEVVLIFDAFAIVGLMYAQGARIPIRAKPLLAAMVGCFSVGLGLATAAGDVVQGRVFSYHALWHVIGAFGFIFFWAFNHVRFQDPDGTWLASTKGLPKG